MYCTFIWICCFFANKLLCLCQCNFSDVVSCLRRCGFVTPLSSYQPQLLEHTEVNSNHNKNNSFSDHVVVPRAYIHTLHGAVRWLVTTRNEKNMNFTSFTSSKSTIDMNTHTRFCPKISLRFILTCLSSDVETFWSQLQVVSS